MGQQGPLGYLNFCGTEVSNSARTVGYLRKGLGNTLQGHWELGPGDVCGVLYRLDGGTCAHPKSFVSPAADPAPWYDASEPGSRTFLGFHLLDIKGYDPTLYRAVANRISGLGGATFSKQHRGPRTWKFRGALISSDDAGAEYGLRWLEDVLQASECASCSTCDLTVRLVCPPSDCSNDSLGEWISYDVALTDGPHEVDQSEVERSSMHDVLGGCRDFVLVEFTMVAGNPYLYKRPQLCLQTTIEQNIVCNDICEFLFGSSSDSVCCVTQPPERGTLSAIYTLSSEGGFGGVVLEAYDSCGGSGSAGSGSGSGSGPTGSPTIQLELSGVPGGSTVVVDSARRVITISTVDPVTGETVTADGTYLVVAAPGQAVQWLEVRDCDDTLCLCVRAAAPCTSGDLTVTVQTQERE